MILRLRNVLVLSAIMLFVVSCASVPDMGVMSLRVPGYFAEVGVHPAKGKPRDVIVISLHQKDHMDANLYGETKDFKSLWAKTPKNIS